MPDEPEVKKPDALQSLFDDHFDVTIDGHKLRFRKGTLRQLLKVDKVYSAIDTAESITDVINLVLPVVEELLQDSFNNDKLLDILTHEKLMWVLAAIRSEITIDFDAKKNSE